MAAAKTRTPVTLSDANLKENIDDQAFSEGFFVADRDGRSHHGLVRIVLRETFFKIENLVKNMRKQRPRALKRYCRNCASKLSLIVGLSLSW
jgi:hypothetical protein